MVPLDRTSQISPNSRGNSYLQGLETNCSNSRSKCGSCSSCLFWPHELILSPFRASEHHYERQLYTELCWSSVHNTGHHLYTISFWDSQLIAVPPMTTVVMHMNRMYWSPSKWNALLCTKTSHSFDVFTPTRTYKNHFFVGHRRSRSIGRCAKTSFPGFRCNRDTDPAVLQFQLTVAAELLLILQKSFRGFCWESYTEYE